MITLLFSSEFLQGFWQGVFELISLCVVAHFVNDLIARRTSRSSKKQEIIDELDEFVISLWKPRKLYTLILEEKLSFMQAITSPEARALKSFELRYQAFEKLLDSIGRLRSVQIKIVTFFGFEVELLAHFTAIWKYLKEIRRRMEKNETLFFGTPRKSAPMLHSSTKMGDDDLYVLIDKFRLLIASTPPAENPPSNLAPDEKLAEKVKSRANSIYTEFFGDNTIQ